MTYRSNPSKLFYILAYLGAIVWAVALLAVFVSKPVKAERYANEEILERLEMQEKNYRRERLWREDAAVLRQIRENERRYDHDEQMELNRRILRETNNEYRY